MNAASQDEIEEEEESPEADDEEESVSKGKKTPVFTPGPKSAFKSQSKGTN